MQDLVTKYLEKFRMERRTRRRLGSIMLVLALVVSFGVYWQLKLTGAAMTNETYCGIEEHTHSDDCYEWVLVCGYDEVEDTEESAEDSAEATGHVHTDDCYEKVLVCGLEEHTHTVACLSDVTADVETSEDWEATLPSELSDDLAEAVVAVAKSQLGYTESSSNFTLAEDGETRLGYTRYGAWAGNEYGTWDAMFASFCLSYAGISTDIFPESTGAYAWAVKLQEQGLYADAASYTPASGDLVFFDTDEDGRIDRVGIVIAVNENESDSTLTVIEGDCAAATADANASDADTADTADADAVCEVEYSLSDESITGFGVLPENESAAETTEATEETDTYTAEADGVSVTVTAPAGALPEGAELTVTLLEEDSDGYAKAAEAVGYDAENKETGMAALDIAFYDKDGQEVEPTKAVTVTIDASAILPEDADASTLEVQHLAETGEGIEPVLVADATKDTAGTVDTATVVAEFEVNGFSTFTISWSTGNGPDETSTSITATTYLSGTATTIGNGSTNLTCTSGTAYDLTSSNASLAIEGYVLVSATVTYGSNKYNATAVTVTIERGSGPDSSTTYTYAYTDSSGASAQLYSGNSAQTITISLYYVVTTSVNVSIVSTSGTALTSSTTTALGQGITTTLSTLASSAYSNNSYTYSYAIVTYTDSNGGSHTVNNANGVVWNSDGTYTITDSSGNEYSATAISIVLVYANNPSVEISAVESSNDYTLTAAPSNFSGTDITYTWTISDTENATLTYDGTTATFTWGSGVAEGTVVTVTVTATYTYTDSYGNEVTETATGTYTMIYGASQSQTVYESELTIYFLESNGSVITEVSNSNSYAGLSGSEVTAKTLAGYYTVGEDNDDENLTYTFYAAYTDYSMTTEIYSIYCNSNGVWYYRTSSSGSWIELDPSTIYLVYCVGTTGETVSESSASNTSGYYHIDVRISGSFTVTVSSTDATGTDVKVTKNWVDNDNSGETRPESITVYLTDASGNKLTDSSSNYYSATLTEENNWSYTWTGLSLDAGTYGVTEDSVSGYTLANSTTFTVSDSSANADDGNTYTGTLTVTKLSSVYITKSNETIIYVSMRPGTTSDDNSASGTNYEYQSLYGHDGFTSNYGPYNLNDGDTITVVISFTYTYYDEDGNEYTGTVEDYEITTTVNSTNNACEKANSGNDMQGFDVELTADSILEQAGIITSESASLTNMLSTTTDLTIVKVDEDNSTTYLEGAEFILYYIGSDEYTYYYSYNSEKEVYYWGTVRDSACKIQSVANSSGVTVSGLTVGITYYLEEVTAPDGYNLLNGTITFTVTSSGVTVNYSGSDGNSPEVSTDDDGNITITIANTPGYSLPSTGGPGTTIFYVIGAIMVFGAAVVLITKRRIRAQ